MTVYQIKIDHLPDDISRAWFNVIAEALIREKVLVPVEPCEHGKIDPHYIDGLGGPQELCPGAGIGETP